MSFRWPAILTLALLVALGLAAATTGALVLLILLMMKLIDERWVRIASLVSIMLPPTVLLVQGYRRQRAKKSGPRGSPT